MAPAPAGRPRRAPDDRRDPQARGRHRHRPAPGPHHRPAGGPAGARGPPRVPRRSRSTARPAWARTASPFEIYKLRTMVDGAEFTGAGPGDRRGRRAHHAPGHAAAPLLARRAAQPVERAARRDVDRRAPPDAQGARSTSTPSASAAGWRSSPGSPAGPRSTAAPRCRGPSGSSSTSGTSSTARCALDLRDPARGRSARSRAAAASTREPTGGWQPPPPDVAVLLTGVGKRYALVSVFAQHAVTVAADPNPAGARPVRRASPALGAALRRPRLCPRAPGAVRGVRRGRGGAAHRPRSRDPRPRAPRQLPAFVPDGEVARATFDKYETHLLLERLGLPSPPTVLPASRSTATR